MISGSMCGGSTAINIIVGTINVIIAAYDLIAAIDMIILGLANPVLLTVALVFLGVAVYAYIDSMFTLFMYCSTGEERYGEEMMTNLYFNVTFGVITKVAGTLGKKVVRKIGDTLVEMGVDSKYVKNFFTEEYGGVSWDDSPGTGGSGSHGSGGNGSGSGSHGTGEIPGGSSGNHGSGGTGSGSGSHGTGYIPGGGSLDYWNFIDAWELLSKKYGEKVASILQEFGEDGLKLAEKYGDDLARIIDNLEPTEAKKAVSLINSYGDEALDLFKEGKSFDEVKKVVESGRKTATIIDYSYKFDRELANFNEGYEIKTTVDKDLILVQYSSDAPDASLCYWTTIDEANEITSLNDYMDKLALSKDWGNRNTVKVARIPAGTKVKYAVGTAREQLLITDPRPGGGIQYLFNQFDTEWITEVRSFSN